MDINSSGTLTELTPFEKWTRMTFPGSNVMHPKTFTGHREGHIRPLRGAVSSTQLERAWLFSHSCMF